MEQFLKLTQLEGQMLTLEGIEPVPQAVLVIGLLQDSTRRQMNFPFLT